MAAKTFDVYSQPAYSISEAARYLRLPPATLRSWVLGRDYPNRDATSRFHPLIRLARKQPPLLSFHNLVEAHVLRALRTEHGVKLAELRKALAYAEKSLDIDHLLLRKDLLTHAGKVFLRKYGELIELSASGQIAMQQAFDSHLKRVEWSDLRFPVRLYPFVSVESVGRPVAIDASIAFGRPVLIKAGVATRTITERLDAGETIDALADDYGLSTADVEEAVLYERAA